MAVRMSRRGGLVARLARVRSQPGPGSAAGTQRSRVDLVRLGHQARCPAVAADPQVRQLAGRPRFVEPELADALRGTAVHEFAPGQVVDVTLRAGPHEARGHDRISIVSPPVVQCLAVDKPSRTGLLRGCRVALILPGFLNHEPLGEAIGVDSPWRVLPELGRIGSRRNTEFRVRHAGHARQSALDARLVDPFQRQAPSIHTRHDGGIARQVDQGARAVGRDDLAAPNLAGGLRIHHPLPASLRSLT